jgi:lipoic acid synthetase
MSATAGSGSADKDEPLNLARTIAAQLKYVVINSVDRDDLRDGGSGHFMVECIQRIRELSPGTTIEVLVPDLGQYDRALEIFESLAARRDEPQPGKPRALYKEARGLPDYCSR